MRSLRGQASVEYVAALSLVAVVLGAITATVGAPWLAPRVAEAIRHGICIVSGALCTTQEAALAGFEPCPIRRRSNVERAAVTAVLRLERGDALLIERRSDGRASVSFVDGGRLGVEAGLGAHLPTGGAGVSAGAGASFHTGRRYDFARWADAQRFLGRYARAETLTGESRELLRGLCLACPERIRGEGPPAPPAPSATFVEGGAYAELEGAAGAPAGVPGVRSVAPGIDGSRARAIILGRRLEGRRTTHYLRLDTATTGELGAVIGSLAGARHAEGILEITREDGRLVQARVRTSGATATEGELRGSTIDLAALAERLRSGAVTTRAGGDLGGLAIEATVTLDLTDSANARAVEAVLHPGISPLGWIERLGTLARRLDLAGSVDLDVYRSTERTDEYEAGAGNGVRVGGVYERSERTRDLLAAWGMQPGGSLRRREDCEAAATAISAS